MKKAIVTCMAIVALFALAGTASAITCTTDQRPAATLLIPWFQVTFNPTDNNPIASGAGALDTFVTIGNASAAPMIAHVSVYNDRSVLVLDFNVALTGFDVQPMSMSSILSGHLPITPIGANHQSVANDVCQRNSAAAVYPNPNGYLRVRPLNPATSADNSIATALYPNPAFGVGSAFQLQTLDSLDETNDNLAPACGGTNGVFSGVIHGYITIDHANYCNLSDPTDARYYSFDAIGNENNLWGEVLYTSGTGLTTVALNAVAVESDRAFSEAAGAFAGGGQGTQTDTGRTRTFYARYWTPSTETDCGNCAGTLASGNNLFLNAPWDTGFGDEREPLGLKYAARYIESGAGGITTHWTVWRAGSGSLTNLTGSSCAAVETIPSLVFYDEDENTVVVSQTPLPSPLPPPTSAINIPLETQRRSPGTTQGPLTGTAGFGFPFPAGAVAGWCSIEFRNLTAGQGGTNLDQAFMSYDLSGNQALLTAGAPGTQLDPSACNPLGIAVNATFGTGTGAQGGVNLITPTIPGGLNGNACSQTASCTGTGPAQ
jgi:hypothetical protein